MSRKVVLGLVALAWAARAQIININNATSFSYSQNFNTLASSGSGNSWTDNSTIPGWWWDSNNAARNPDSYGYIADPGTDTTGAGHSYGASGSSERAIGALSSSGTDISIGVQFVNGSGSPISLANILISYVGEQWRRQTAAQTLTFSYQISSSPIANTLSGTWTPQTALNFTGPQVGSAGAIDGNSPANQVSFSSVPLASSGSLGSGQYLMLRWYKTGTSSPGLAVDDFQLAVVPEPGSVAMLALGATLVKALRRRRR
ncbi:MAG: PEP-CTERM sorting domain-containing protein [Kiritimatiellae bacterium]|nr:PEP-CTERM sorting domain-containing protein [Kiritimatiellia bacterium]